MKKNKILKKKPLQSRRTESFIDCSKGIKKSRCTKHDATEILNYRKFSGQQTFKGTHQSEQADFGPRSKSDKIKMCQSLEAGQGRAPDTRENAIKRLWDHPQDLQTEKDGQCDEVNMKVGK